MGQLGEDLITEMEQFPHLGLAKTYVHFKMFISQVIETILWIQY